MTPHRLLWAAAEAGYLWLFVTVVGWGLNWPLIKIVLRDWPPLLARGSASLAAGFGLAALVAARGGSLAIPAGQRLRVLLAALVNVTAWMGGPTVALLWLSVAEGALLVYTMAIWAMLLAWPMRGQRPTARGVASLLLGFAGIAILFAERGLSLDSGKLPGILLTLAASVIFAFGTVALRAPAGVGPIPFVAWQVGLGGLPLLAISALLERDRWGGLSAEGVASLAYMAAVPMGVCYLAWFAALRRLPAAVAANGTLLVPVVGIGSAALILGEPLGLREAAALVLVLAGVALAIRRT